eukprot:jgi/Bigna1/136061/aug1.32_g10769
MTERKEKGGGEKFFVEMREKKQPIESRPLFFCYAKVVLVAILEALFFLPLNPASCGREFLELRRELAEATNVQERDFYLTKEDGIEIDPSRKISAFNNGSTAAELGVKIGLDVDAVNGVIAASGKHARTMIRQALKEGEGSENSGYWLTLFFQISESQAKELVEFELDVEEDGFEVNEQLRITEVVKGTKAELLGVQCGWRIIYINDKRVRNLEDAVNAFHIAHRIDLSYTIRFRTDVQKVNGPQYGTVLSEGKGGEVLQTVQGHITGKQHSSKMLADRVKSTRNLYKDINQPKYVMARSLRKQMSKMALLDTHKKRSHEISTRKLRKASTSISSLGSSQQQRQSEKSIEMADITSFPSCFSPTNSNNELIMLSPRRDILESPESIILEDNTMHSPKSFIFEERNEKGKRAGGQQGGLNTREKKAGEKANLEDAEGRNEKMKQSKKNGDQVSKLGMKKRGVRGSRRKEKSTSSTRRRRKAKLSSASTKLPSSSSSNVTSNMEAAGEGGAMEFKRAGGHRSNKKKTASAKRIRFTDDDVRGASAVAKPLAIITTSHEGHLDTNESALQAENARDSQTESDSSERKIEVQPQQRRRKRREQQQSSPSNFITSAIPDTSLASSSCSKKKSNVPRSGKDVSESFKNVTRDFDHISIAL